MLIVKGLLDLIANDVKNPDTFLCIIFFKNVFALKLQLETLSLKMHSLGQAELTISQHWN